MLRTVTIVLALLMGSHLTLAQPAPKDWENWLTDFSKHSIPLEEIFSGGPPKDGIPSISNPKFVDVSDVENIADNEPVISLKIGKDVRAYPLSVLMWHEIVNDVVGDKPVVVTYCPLCNSAIVFDGEVEGKRMMFGTTGRLRNSDMVMYDRRTESWWQQFTGEAIVGKLTGTRLNILPSRLESFSSYKKRFPKGKVLVPREPGLRKYGENPYVGYDTLAKPFLFDGELPKEIKPMTYVVAVPRKGEAPFVVTLEKLREDGKIVSGKIVLTWKEGLASALDTPKISAGREIGNVIVTDSKSGDDLHYDLTFAFVVHAFHRDAPIFTRDGKLGGTPEALEAQEAPSAKDVKPKEAKPTESASSEETEQLEEAIAETVEEKVEDDAEEVKAEQQDPDASPVESSEPAAETSVAPKLKVVVPKTSPRKTAAPNEAEKQN